MAKKKSDATVPFEEALSQLEVIVQKLEGSDLKLDESIELFRQGVELAGFCNNKLSDVQQQVQKVLEDSQGNLFVEKLNMQED